jgi:hypothetical protein
MALVVSPHLRAVDAVWTDGADAGAWIAEHLGPFGPSVSHAVPLGYPAYGVVPIPDADDDGDSRPELVVLDSLLATLEPFTDSRPVYAAMWDGWPSWYETGADAAAEAAKSIGMYWSDGGHPPSREEIERLRTAAARVAAAEMIETPDTKPLELPHRRYHVWTGPLHSTLAFRHDDQPPPSLIWPEDRAWLVGVPIYTFEIAVAACTAAIDAVVANSRLGARRSTPDEVLESDD